MRMQRANMIFIESEQHSVCIVLHWAFKLQQREEKNSLQQMKANQTDLFFVRLSVREDKWCIDLCSANLRLKSE